MIGAAEESPDAWAVAVRFDRSRWEDDAVRPAIIVTTNSGLEPTYRMNVRVRGN